MKAIQYTIRNIPPEVDKYYRTKAKLSGKSLNQVIIDDLVKKTGNKPKSVVRSLEWFIGSNTIEQSCYDAWEQDEITQKELTKKQWLKNDN